MIITDKEYQAFQAGIKLKDFNTIWNMAIETAARWLETANRNDTDDAAEIRKLKQ